MQHTRVTRGRKQERRPADLRPETDRLQQPLTQPYVLSQQWNRADAWTEMHERESSREMRCRVVAGLIRRCRRRIYLGISQYDERGYEQVGELRVVFDHLLRAGRASARAVETVALEEEGV